MIIQRQKTAFVTKVFNSAADVSLHSKCNGFSIKNTGTTNLQSQNELYLPGEAKTFGCNAGEVVAGLIDIVFVAPAIAPAVVLNSATITEKIFID